MECTHVSTTRCCRFSHVLRYEHIGGTLGWTCLQHKPSHLSTNAVGSGEERARGGSTFRSVRSFRQCPARRLIVSHWQLPVGTDSTPSVLLLRVAFTSTPLGTHYIRDPNTPSTVLSSVYYPVIGSYRRKGGQQCRNHHAAHVLYVA